MKNKLAGFLVGILCFVLIIPCLGYGGVPELADYKMTLNYVVETERTLFVNTTLEDGIIVDYAFPQSRVFFCQSIKKEKNLIILQNAVLYDSTSNNDIHFTARNGFGYLFKTVIIDKGKQKITIKKEKPFTLEQYFKTINKSQ